MAFHYSLNILLLTELKILVASLLYAFMCLFSFWTAPDPFFWHLVNGQINKEIVKTQRVIAPVGQMQLKSLIEAHVVRLDCLNFLY